MPSVALIVRCFNEERHIGRLLTGALRQTRPPDEIIVVDSGSTDRTLTIASGFDVRLITISPDEFSFGRALNRGMSAAAGCDLCVLASAHVYPVYDTWLEHLAGALHAPDVALAYGRQQTPPSGRFSEARLLHRWFPADSAPRQNHPFCNNANAAVRRAVWEELPYDEELTGLEDLDWAKRAMGRGHAISYVAEAPVVHVHDESFAAIVNRYRREAIAHKQIFAEQRMTVVEAMQLAAFNIWGDLRAASAEGSLAPHLVDIVWFRAAQFYGTQRGFSQAGPVPEAVRRRFYYPAANGRAPAAPVDGRIIEYDLSAVP
jgi:glycosyltransferase involved in cell wall biosynthesis